MSKKLNQSNGSEGIGQTTVTDAEEIETLSKGIALKGFLSPFTLTGMTVSEIQRLMTPKDIGERVYVGQMYGYFTGFESRRTEAKDGRPARDSQWLKGNISGENMMTGEVMSSGFLLMPPSFTSSALEMLKSAGVNGSVEFYVRVWLIRRDHAIPYSYDITSFSETEPDPKMAAIRRAVEHRVKVEKRLAASSPTLIEGTLAQASESPEEAFSDK